MGNKYISIHLRNGVGRVKREIWWEHGYGEARHFRGLTVICRRKWVETAGGIKSRLVWGQRSQVPFLRGCDGNSSRENSTSHKRSSSFLYFCRIVGNRLTCRAYGSKVHPGRGWVTKSRGGKFLMSHWHSSSAPYPKTPSQSLPMTVLTSPPPQHFPIILGMYGPQNSAFQRVFLLFTMSFKFLAFLSPQDPSTWRTIDVPW